MRYRKLASPWYESGETLTVYHGTAREWLPVIQREGLKPLDVERLTYDLLKEHGIPPDEANREVWHEFRVFRDQPLVYVTTSKETASRYARHAGEADAVIREHIRLFHKDRVRPEMFFCKLLHPVVLKLEIPWDFISAENRDRLSKAMDAYHHYEERGLTPTDRNWLAKADFELHVDKTIPPSYIVGVEEVPMVESRECD